MDELGSGTDPGSGSAIARAILEHLIETDKCRIVATTHSPQLKTLQIVDNRFRCASVLLQDSCDELNGYKLPSYKLAYDVTGESYLLGAASRCQPPLSQEIMKRAADLMTNSESKWDGHQILSMQDSIQKDREAAARSRKDAADAVLDTRMRREATICMARAYEARLKRIEHRLNEQFKRLKADDSKSGYDVIGDSLESLCLAKKQVVRDADLLAEKGLRVVPPTYELSQGEMVVVIAKGEWEGETAVVKEVNKKTGQIVLSASFGWDCISPERAQSDQAAHFSELGAIIMTRKDIALWDYPDIISVDNKDNSRKGKSNGKPVDKLFSLLLEMKPTLSTSEGPAVKYTSSRERKTTTAAARKEKKRLKKKH